MRHTDVGDLWYDGYVPTRHYLDAAVRLWSVLAQGRPSSRQGLHESFRLLPTDGVFSDHDFAIGEMILLAAGIARCRGDLIELVELPASVEAGDADAEVLLARLLKSLPPAWLTAATRGLEVAAHLVPHSAWHAITSTIWEPERREALLIAVGAAVEDERSQKVGLAGELAVVAGCRAALEAVGRPDLAADVRHISLESDLLGYDVTSPDTADRVRRIEVKTTKSRAEEFDVHLSRGQAEVARRDRNWCLVLCRHSSEETEILGWLRGNDILPSLPRDNVPSGFWMKARLRIQVSDLEKGLPIVT